MNKMLSTLVTALLAVSFAGFVFAAETARKEAGPAPAAPAAGEMKKEETRLAPKKGKKAKKARKSETKTEEKKEAAPTVAPEKK
jgi:hypothetical protein